MVLKECTYHGGVLTLPNGVKVRDLDKHGFTPKGGIVNAMCSSGKYYINSKCGEDSTVFVLKEDGAFRSFPVNVIKSALYCHASWEGVSMNIDDSPLYRVRHAFDTIGECNGVYRHRYMLSSDGSWGCNPRVYFVKGKIKTSLCSNSLSLFGYLNAVFNKVILDDVPSNFCKYTISEYPDCFVLTHYVWTVPATFSAYPKGEALTLPWVSYKFDKNLKKIRGVSCSDTIKYLIDCSVAIKSSSNIGAYMPFSKDKFLAEFRKHLIGSVQSRLLSYVKAVFDEIAVFSGKLGNQTNYFEVTRGTGTPDVWCGDDVVNLCPEVGCKGLTCSEDVYRDVYIGSTYMCLETGFSGTSGRMYGSNAVCLMF